MDSRAFLALNRKDVGSSPVAFKYFFHFFFDLLVFLSLFLIFLHNWIHLFQFGMRLCNKYSTVNKFNKPACDFTLCTLNNS